MSTIKATKIARKYGKYLKSKGYSFSAIYLFGSQAKGRAHKWSDIDVAVVSNRLKKNYERNLSMLDRMSLDVDDRLETHGFTEEDFASDADPLAYEIRRTGIRVV